jgi:hypothetical protein
MLKQTLTPGHRRKIRFFIFRVKKESKDKIAKVWLGFLITH